MGGVGSGTSRKRAALPRRDRRGALTRVDWRKAEGRFVRDGVVAIAEDQGGADALSFLARRTAQRAMHLDALLLRDEVAMTNGQPVDVAQYLAGAATWLRYTQALGLARKAKPAPRALDYVKEPPP